MSKRRIKDHRWRTAYLRGELGRNPTPRGPGKTRTPKPQQPKFDPYTDLPRTGAQCHPGCGCYWSRKLSEQQAQ